VEITKEVLQTRITGMGEQMKYLLAEGNRIQASIHEVKGAITFCKELMAQLETPKPDDEQSTEETEETTISTG